VSRNLADLQRAMAELVRTGKTTSRDDYAFRVQDSGGLEVLRECIAEWRELLVRRACPLTAAALEKRGELGGTVRNLLRHYCPPFLHDLALAFLDEVRNSDSELADVAAFEAEMIRVYSGAGSDKK
jgi:hypothetical protein